MDRYETCTSLYRTCTTHLFKSDDASAAVSEFNSLWIDTGRAAQGLMLLLRWASVSDSR